MQKKRGRRAEVWLRLCVAVAALALLAPNCGEPPPNLLSVNVGAFVVVAALRLFVVFVFFRTQQIDSNRTVNYQHIAVLLYKVIHPGQLELHA